MRYEPLGKFVELTQGLAVNKGTADLFSDDMDEEFVYPLLRIVDFENGKKDHFSKYVSKKVSKNVIIDENAIVFTRVTCQCFRGFSGVLHNNLFKVELCSEEISRDYLFTVLQSDFVKRQAISYAQSSVVPDLSHEMFKSIIIPIPELGEQEKIAALYLGLSDKINNNHMINDEMDAVISSLYNYWFLQFDYPDVNGEPYSHSGGMMIYNEEYKRDIPLGWSIVKLRELASYSDERIDNMDVDKHSYIGTDNLIPEMKGRTVSDYTPEEGSSTQYREGDTLISNIRPYFKKIWFAQRNGACSADVLCVRAHNKEISEFIYASLARDDFFNYDMAGSKGSKMPRGDKSHIMEYPIMFNEQKAIEYSQMVREMFLLKEKNYQETVELNSLQNYILPLLLNGQVKL